MLLCKYELQWWQGCEEGCFEGGEIISNLNLSQSGIFWNYDARALMIKYGICGYVIGEKI